MMMKMTDRQRDMLWWVGLAAAAILLTIVLFAALAWALTGGGA